jgi:outer membrane immunogenic protein
LPAKTGNYCNTPFELGPSGWLGGAKLGVNWQSGNFVFGVEGDLGWLDVSADRTLFRPFNDRDIASVKYEWYGTWTGRRWVALLYVKGGVAFADITTRAADIDLVAGSFEIYQGSLIRQSDVHAGWAVGLEYALGGPTFAQGGIFIQDFSSPAKLAVLTETLTNSRMICTQSKSASIIAFHRTGLCL